MEYGLIGEKLGHSFSKEIHEKLAVYTYDLCPVAKQDLDSFMTRRKFRAINVTIPYKQAVIPYLKEMDADAQAVGAVNTIVNRDGNLYGYNTDLPGFLYMVKKNNVDMKGKKAVILGNGGAAQAVKAAVKRLNAAQMIVVGHNVIKENVITYDECFKKHNDAQIVINTSPVGMYPDNDSSPVDLKRFPNCEAVLDIVYNPPATKLVKQARDLKMTGVNGLEMLIAQAKYAVEIFLDTKIDDTKIDEIYRDMQNKY